MTTILLLAGTSSRMGRNKLLLPYRGRFLFEHALEAALEGSGKVICVTGNDKKEIEAALAPYDVEVRRNPNYEDGQKSSSLVGLEDVDDDVAILAGDYPLLTAADFATGWRMLYAHPAARPSFEGVPGHPVFVRREILKGLRETPKPFREYLEKSGMFEYDASWRTIFDVDTPEAYARLLDLEDISIHR